MLLTAFKGNYNTSKLLLDGLQGDYIYKKLLTNSFTACEREIVEAIAAYQPEHVISFGQKPMVNSLYIEPAASNNGEIMKSTFNISALINSLSAYGIPYKVSKNPSNYLCNHAYYHGLQYIEKNGLNIKMIFIHVPDRKRFENMDAVAAWLHDFCRDRLCDY